MRTFFSFDVVVSMFSDGCYVLKRLTVDEAKDIVNNNNVTLIRLSNKVQPAVFKEWCAVVTWQGLNGIKPLGDELTVMTGAYPMGRSLISEGDRLIVAQVGVRENGTFFDARFFELASQKL